MSAGLSAWKSGLNPLKSTVRSSAGAVRAMGIVSPSDSLVDEPTSWVSAM
jgi:hypothetical protein